MAERYTYNAIAEHPIIPEFDDTEEKFKWNGALLNLSDLPFNEYTKTIYNITGEITGDTKVLTNTVTLDCVNTGDTYEVVISSQYPCNSELNITVEVDGAQIALTLPQGGSSAKASTTIPSASERPSLANVTVNPVKDDVYTYVVKAKPAPGPVIPTEFDAYYGVYLEKNLNRLTADEVKSMGKVLVNAEGSKIQYIIPHRDVQIQESDIPNYKYALICAIPKTIYDNEKYSLMESTFQVDDFVRLSNVEIDESQYTVLKNVKEDTEYVSRYMEDITYEFVVKYAE